MTTNDPIAVLNDALTDELIEMACFKISYSDFESYREYDRAVVRAAFGALSVSPAAFSLYAERAATQPAGTAARNALFSTEEQWAQISANLDRYVRGEGGFTSPADAINQVLDAPVAATQPAGEVLGYAMFRFGVQHGIERFKYKADSWKDAVAIPLVAAPISEDTAQDGFVELNMAYRIDDRAPASVGSEAKGERLLEGLLRAPFCPEDFGLFGESAERAKHYCEAVIHHRAAPAPTGESLSVPEWRKPTQSEADKWAERNGIRQIDGDRLITAMEDAATYQSAAKESA